MVLISHIDEIARREQRDVLYLEFHPADREMARRYDFHQDPIRAEIIAWLDGHAIGWAPCGPYAVVHRIEGYKGQIYLDTPYDEELDHYRKLRGFLEHDDGRVKHVGIRFLIMSLNSAMKNAAHDAPGFWEQFGIS